MTVQLCPTFIILQHFSVIVSLICPNYRYPQQWLYVPQTMTFAPTMAFAPTISQIIPIFGTNCARRQIAELPSSVIEC